jgi:hypothetical protein
MSEKLTIDHLITLLKEKVGVVFNAENSDAFETHLETLTANGTQGMVERVSILFAYWSNINLIAEAHDPLQTELTASIALLQAYKASISTELGFLCPMLISEAVGKDVQIQTPEQFELFKKLLKGVDNFVREKKLSDEQANVLLMDSLHKYLFRLDDQEDPPSINN